MPKAPEHFLPRSPRVAYSAPVRLSGAWSDREPCFVPMLAQSLDLSEQGMALVTALDVAPGSIVTCSMRIGGRQIYLVGKVVWAGGGEEREGGLKRVGIRFEQPGEDDRAVMRRLLVLGREHPHRVSVRFEGRPESIHALAQITRSGVALTAPLSILRRDTGVRVAFEAGGDALHGKVDGVQLSDVHGMPALRVGIRLPVVQAALAHELAYGRADSTPASVEVPIPRDDAERAPALFGRMLRRPHAARDAALIACGLLVLSFGGFRWQSLTPVEAEEPLVHAASAPIEAPPSEPPIVAQAAPSPPVAAVPTAAPEPLAPITYKWRKARREMLVPVLGSSAGLRHYRLSEPPAIAIDLPNAQVESARRELVHRPGVTRIDVVPADEGARIRVWLKPDVASYRVEGTKQGVRIVLPVER